MKPAASLFKRNISAPFSSPGLPKRPMGVAASTLAVLAAGVPSSSYSSPSFCFVTKKPGAMALTRIPALAKCTASHCVKLLSAATAPLYTGILVRGRSALADQKR